MSIDILRGYDFSMTPKTLDEAAKEVGVTRQSIHTWITTGKLTTWKTDASGNYLITDESMSELNDFVNCVNIENRRYLGSKTRLLGFIDDVVKHIGSLSPILSVADLFGGTGVVSNMFLKQGKSILINDILDENICCYLTFFGTTPVDHKKLVRIISQLNRLHNNRENYMSKSFGNKYFTEDNAKKIGWIREEISKIRYIQHLNNREYAILLTSLIYATDHVANTVGHYDAYRRKLDTTQPIKLLVPNYNKNSHANTTIYHEDANQLVKKSNFYADLVYIDPPYNSRQYGDNYHVLENLVDWKKPHLQGVAMKPAPSDRKKTKSAYSTNKAPEVFDDLIMNINAKFIMVSYNNMAQKGAGRSNAKISEEDITTTLAKRSSLGLKGVKRFSKPFQVFSTGNTRIKNHEEILYVVQVTKRGAHD